MANLCSRDDNLESLSSRHSNNNNDLQVVIVEQPSDLECRQDKQVYNF